MDEDAADSYIPSTVNIKDELHARVTDVFGPAASMHFHLALALAVSSVFWPVETN